MHARGKRKGINRFLSGHGGLWVLAAVAWFSADANGQNPAAEAQDHLRAANEAYRDKDYAAFTRSLETALALNPASLATRYNLASGYALTARPERALELLRELVAARIDYSMADDPDLESLRQLPAFRSLVADLEANTAPVINSTPYYSLEQLDLVPEGIAFDAATGRLFFGSMRSGDIFVLDADRGLTKFATVDREGKRSAIGMTVDRSRGLLWVVGTTFDMAENFDADAPTLSGIFGFDLASGELEREHSIENAVFGLNDVAVGPHGELYASGGVLHVLDEGEQRLVPLRTTPALFGSNGITAEPGGRMLFVSSYPVGIASIDLATGAARFLDAPENTSLYGIDGLYWHDGDLVRIQNGVKPWRLLRMRLNADKTAVVRARIVEMANDAALPTTGAIIGDHIRYIGQGPVPEEAPSHVPPALAPFLGETIIRSAPLDP